VLTHHTGGLRSEVLIVYGNIDERTTVDERHTDTDRCGEFIVTLLLTRGGWDEHIGVSPTQTKAIAGAREESTTTRIGDPLGTKAYTIVIARCSTILSKTGSLSPLHIGEACSDKEALTMAIGSTDRVAHRHMVEAT
jgi:hypothetical protein